MELSTMKAEKVKLWGMFKLKTKMMKIILVQRPVDDYFNKNSQETKRTIFLQIDDVKVEQAKKPERPERIQDFKENS